MGRNNIYFWLCAEWMWIVLKQNTEKRRMRRRNKNEKYRACNCDYGSARFGTRADLLYVL